MEKILIKSNRKHIKIMITKDNFSDECFAYAAQRFSISTAKTMLGLVGVPEIILPIFQIVLRNRYLLALTDVRQGLKILTSSITSAIVVMVVNFPRSFGCFYCPTLFLIPGQFLCFLLLINGMVLVYCST